MNYTERKSRKEEGGGVGWGGAGGGGGWGWGGKGGGGGGGREGEKAEIELGERKGCYSNLVVCVRDIMRLRTRTVSSIFYNIGVIQAQLYL